MSSANKAAIVFLRMENVVAETGVGPLARYNPEAMAQFDLLIKKLVAEKYNVGIIVSTDALPYHEHAADDVAMLREECALYAFAPLIRGRLPSLEGKSGELVATVGGIMETFRRAKFAVIWPGSEIKYTPDIDPHLVQIAGGTLFGPAHVDQAFITIAQGRAAYRFFERAMGLVEQQTNEATANALAETCIFVSALGTQLPHLLANDGGEKNFAELHQDHQTYNSLLPLLQNARTAKVELLKKIVEIDAQIDADIERIEAILETAE